ncbi:uncharacterized protein MYCFIDRAFT_170207 [Pseudocercospora fijiensis CIRAD86]|uniref:Uncharacterized protein n=1 Tax=Pseudocercospora fijiensis (strain CIRAD86) TaxID=383855 RepID=N1QA07_PSEFD|nr:uncharacterized protein MYCFIDRAFT_170207 [Pseudocercospora fijiensis CIRAD86]EME88616.1 hypothetical protein MYCFIDRAFT_170207 [Pseudocercospora fijiensis CIRAD86]
MAPLFSAQPLLEEVGSLRNKESSLSQPGSTQVTGMLVVTIDVWGGASAFPFARFRSAGVRKEPEAACRATSGPAEGVLAWGARYVQIISLVRGRATVGEHGMSAAPAIAVQVFPRHHWLSAGKKCTMIAIRANGMPSHITKISEMEVDGPNEIFINQ